jgi:hypothetical protein
MKNILWAISNGIGVAMAFTQPFGHSLAKKS